MPRPRLALAAAAAVLAALPAAPASAKIVELGSFPDDPPPTCPQKANPTAPSDFCRIVTRTTGYQVRSGTYRNPTTVPGNGRIVAFTLRLGDLTKAQIARANATYGGSSRVRLTILREAKGTRSPRTVVGQSNDIFTAPFFGGTTQFSLSRSLKVRKGDFVGVTVRTWAPMLALGLAETNSWRTSRPPGSCDDFTSQSAMLELGLTQRFGCGYSTARLTYSATFIPAAVIRFDRNHNPVRR